MLTEIRCLRVASQNIRTEMTHMIHRLREQEEEMRNIHPCKDTTKTCHGLSQDPAAPPPKHCQDPENQEYTTTQGAVATLHGGGRDEFRRHHSPHTTPHSRGIVPHQTDTGRGTDAEEWEELDRKKRMQSNKRFRMLVDALKDKISMPPENTHDVGDYG